MRETRHHISSAVIVTRPQATERISGEMEKMEGVEIHATQGGKIVVVIEGPHSGVLGDRLLQISALDDVIAAHMVFEQEITDKETSDDGRTYAA